ncbi:MAG: hypothetical protein A4E49_02838 [Methanosaeta sp. PtaU1.Bin112]|nr:MAG: hypothetical protein A4E49_02838 [Methanosaeta sp. PtaU1.Bin112]
MRLKEGEISHRWPLGCPINYFLKMPRNRQWIIILHLVGPVRLLQGLPAPEDIGNCAGRPSSQPQQKAGGKGDGGNPAGATP